MHEIKSIGVLSAAKVMGALYFILGEIAAFFVALAALAHGQPGKAVLALVFVGAVQGVIGFVLVGVFSWLYNQIAARIGGIEVQTVPFGS
ncbi:MAG TPA: hypothetical protein VGY99_28325 [Candidatus Binataceae bacterium]|jgi:hypothetical protein|nr:hypothetical protein [Candidatus Binataceae bacterium]